MYEEIKNWIVGSDHPDAPKFSGAGLSVPGCSTHVRSDSSDVDEYVDMKSFLAGSSARKCSWEVRVVSRNLVSKPWVCTTLSRFVITLANGF